MSWERESEFDKARQRYNERSKALSEMKSLLKKEGWLLDHEEDFSTALKEQSSYMEKTYENHDRREKLKYAARAMNIAKLSAQTVREIFLLSEEEMKLL